MDQDRDTTDNAKSSRRGRFWLEKGRSEPRTDAAADQNSPPPGKGFEEIPAPPTSRLDPAVEPLPTLFELPDRTPEGVLRRREKNQFSIHDAHSGPPASHVDPPSGNHSQISRPGPTSPASSDSVLPDPVAETSEYASVLPTPMIDEQSSQDEKRVAAYRDDAMTWAERTSLVWGSRSAIVMLMLMMVTLAFFFGRGINHLGKPSEDSRLTDADDLGDTVVVITEDSEAINDFIAAETSESVENDTPAVNHPPSYVSNPQASAGTLGEPAASFLAEDDLAFDPFDANLTAPDGSAVPPIFETNDSVVAFRSSESINADPPVASNDLPPGMEGRLRLEDGLHYSDTPYAIGNFLEILKAWEASESQQ